MTVNHPWRYLRPMIFNKGQDRRAELVSKLGLSGGPDFLKSPRRACHPDKGIDPEDWYSEHARVRARAIRICRTCLFQQACDEYATQQSERYGVWGGYHRTVNGGRKVRA